MSANMIAAVIITVLSCVAVVFFVVLLSSGVLQRLKKEVFRYIKVYNAYLEEAAAKDEEKAKDTDLQIKEEAIGLPADPAIPFIAKNAPMQKQDFFADYLKIRSAFRANPAQVLKDFPKENPSAGNVAWYREMLDKLSFDSVYKISCLQGK